MAGRRVLITGAGSHLGTLLAQRLEADPEIEHVAGLDTRRPKRRLERTEWIGIDIRDPRIARVVPRLAIDTLVHNQIVRQPGPGMSARAMHDINVIGSLQLLAACERSRTLETIVVRGSAGIYGAEPHAPQFFGEEMTRLFPLRTRFQRDVAEIEDYFATFARRHETVCCTMLRYQPGIGPSVDTQVSRYLSQPACPTYLGFDPRIQLVHEDDALEALVAAVRTPVRGPVNVAGEGHDRPRPHDPAGRTRVAADRRSAVRSARGRGPPPRPDGPFRRLPAAAPLWARRRHPAARRGGGLPPRPLHGRRRRGLGRPP